MPLCDQILPDLDAVFFQTDDFAQKHVLNGKPMLVVDDTDSLIDWTEAQYATTRKSIASSKRRRNAACTS